MKIFTTFILGLVLSGCLQTRGQVREAEQKTAMQQQVSTLQKTNADVNNRFAEIDEQMRLQNGRIEVLENKLSTSGQDRDREKKDLTDQNAELTRKVALLQESLINMERQVNQLASEAASSGARTEKTAGNAPSSSKKTSYEVGEDHFNRKDWKKAILNYEKYRQEHPKGKNFADATYKIGVSFQELKMKDEAKTFYEEVISKFPNTDEARRAKTRIKNAKK
jgi:TolA-binding protein